MPSLSAASYTLNFPVAGSAWYYQLADGALTSFAFPTVEVDGQLLGPEVRGLHLAAGPRALPNGTHEAVFQATYPANPTITLAITLRYADDSAVIRWRYTLTSSKPAALTKEHGEGPSYTAIALLEWPRVTEVRVSEFQELVHSFCLSEREVPERQFAAGLPAMGPILAAGDGQHALLLAYEHGSQVPDAFIHFALQPDRTAVLTGVKGNYYARQSLAGDGYTTVWLQAALVRGDLAELARAYRYFALHRWSPTPASRQPHLFYNTWAWQERNKWWHGHAYLDSMHQAHILTEIDIAHRMGLEVFVLDTGWYGKTGDWEVNRDRFPDGLAAVRERLARYGMRLGLWFDPRSAALTSRMHQQHQDCVMSWQGKEHTPHEVWETEAAQPCCLVTRFADHYATELIRLIRELGVTYFKWDAIHQYGCDSASHQHGGPDNPPQERADCYAFALGQAMVHIVEQVTAACPDAIVDFDITEGHRYVGLGFLAAGKYFLINNGPYLSNYDLPHPPGTWSNIFVYPGAARTRICRTPLDFDRWLPSVLFLTHYLPDPPRNSQVLNIASLILGQNGVWGDLLRLQDSDVAVFAHLVGLYKQIRHDLTAAYPVRSGSVGGTPEIHEKLAANGRGAVVLFTPHSGRYHYVTATPVATTWVTEGPITVTRQADGHALLTAEITEPGAAIVFFGAHAPAASK